MKYPLKKTVVVGLGGSVIAPEQIDEALLKQWVSIVKKYSRVYRFVIVLGGGRIARTYQNAAESIAHPVAKEKDWIGIQATRLNAELVRVVFGEFASKKIIDSEEAIGPLKKPVTIACGWTPGWSTDFIAATLADRYHAGVTIMAGKPSHIYDKNPDIYKGAKKLTHISWKEYDAIVPKRWTPGANAPIDPVCARFSKKYKISSIVIDGRNMKNFEQLLLGKEFEGTLVE